MNEVEELLDDAREVIEDTVEDVDTRSSEAEDIVEGGLLIAVEEVF